MEETCILVDENDKFLGYAPRSVCHTGKGKHHRAFVTLLINNNRQVLLQKRKHKLFNGLWDFTAISHPLHLEKVARAAKDNRGFSQERTLPGTSAGFHLSKISHDETYQEASDRALQKEMGIKHVKVQKAGGFNYFAKEGPNCENEYCEVLLGQYGGLVKSNAKEVYETNWVDFDQFMLDIKKNPGKYTVWAKEGAKIIESSTLIDSNLNVFQQDLKRFSNEFEKFKTDYFKRLKAGKKDLQLQIYSEMERFTQDGKGLRPYLLWLGYRLAKERNGIPDTKYKILNTVLPACLAVELTHHFLLVHDDIIDNSDTRRGRPTIHKTFEATTDPLYGRSMAILVGDLYLSEALKLIGQLDFPEKTKSTFFSHWLQVVTDTITGEALDVRFSRKEASVKEISNLQDLKTARYTFIGPLVGGAILGSKESLGGEGSLGKKLQEFGMALGRAYQLKDDLLGVFGDEMETGKSPLSDMREGKQTLMFCEAKRGASPTEMKVLGNTWGNPKSGEKDLKKVREIFEQSRALFVCEQKLTRLVKLAKGSINGITKEKLFQQILAGCCSYVLERKN